MWDNRLWSQKSESTVKKRKKEEEEGEKSNISVTARHTSAQISQRFLSACRETPQVFAPRNYGAFEVRGRTQMASSSLQHASSLIRCCLLCFLFCFFLFKYVCLCWRIAAAHRCNDIQIGGVICQVHFASGSTMGRSVHCVTERQRKKKQHYTSPVFTEQFHPACNAWRIELGALSSLQMWQISTVAPFDTKCGTIIELVQP